MKQLSLSISLYISAERGIRRPTVSPPVAVRKLESDTFRGRKLSSLTEGPSPERRHRRGAADVGRGRSRRVDLDGSTKAVVVERLLPQELTYVVSKAGVAPASLNTSANWPRLAGAGRGWPRLAEAGDQPELDLANGWCRLPHRSLPPGGSPCSGCTAHSSWHSSSSDRTKPHTPCTACAYRPSGTVPCLAASPSHPRQRSAISAWCCCSVPGCG